MACQSLSLSLSLSLNHFLCAISSSCYCSSIILISFLILVIDDEICHRFSIKGRVYPAILPVEKKKVIGMVLSGITPLELHIFDIFEDVEYKRCTVEVSLMHGGFLQDGSQKLQAHAYVWANSGDPNLYGDWIFEEWRQAQMKDFIKMTMRFMEELEQPESKARVETYESFYQPSG
ncbi:unnamed protein product [Camellia sinensis]